MDWYTLSRQWFDFAFENPEKIKSEHAAIYFLACEQWNRFWQKEKFGFPSYFSMEVSWIKNHKTYQKYFKDLVQWGFIKVIQESKNQHSSCIIALVKNDEALTKALDKANAMHLPKHMQGTATIDKQLNKKTIKQENNMEQFKEFYEQSLNTSIENRNATQFLVVCFFDLWYVPSKNETVESLREWLVDTAKLKWKTASEMIEIINSWHVYWKGMNKEVKNHKASLLNNFLLKWK